MSSEIQRHPDIFAGPLDRFASYKIERQSKSVIKNILTKFFDKYSNIYELVAPEIEEVQNTQENPKLFIEKEFPFFERKLPCAIISCGQKQEMKPFIGSDDYVYSEHIRSSTGVILAQENMYANMFQVPITIGIGCLSVEQRMQLEELITLCFTHYYRWAYHYKDIDGSLFNIVPNTSRVAISGENELIDKDTSTVIYTGAVSMIASVEYIFKDVADNFDISFVTGFELVQETITTSTGLEYTIGMDPINFSLEWE